MSTETQEQEKKPQIDKLAFKNLSVLVRENIKEIEASDKPSKKALKRLTDIQAALGPVRDLLRSRLDARNEAQEKVKLLEAENLHLTEMAEAEPVKNVIEIRRLPSAFSGVKGEDFGTAQVDSFAVDSDPNAVITRIKPLTAVDAGVVGFKVFVTDTVAHVILFTNLITVVEAREGRPLNIDADSSDALKIYQEGLTLAIAIADSYTKLYGAFASIPLLEHKNEEAESIPSTFSTGDSLVDVETEDDTDESGDEESGDEEDESDGDETLDGVDGPTQEEIAQRMADEDDDDVGE